MTLATMDFLLDEKSQSLKEIIIDETCASDRELWKDIEKQKGSPADVTALIAALPAGKLRIFVQDRVLCDATRSEVDTPGSFRAYRRALWSRQLKSITPLANQDRSFKPKDEPDSFSICTYGTTPATKLRMDAPQERLDETPADAWTVAHKEVDAARRLDCWYYQPRFVRLRKEREAWQRLSDLFSSDTTRGNDKPVENAPARGALRWISSAQIHERLHAIDHTRLRDWGDARQGDVPLDPGDLLISMAGFTQVKIARYHGPRNAATRSLYLLRFQPKERNQSPEEAAALWFALTHEDFLDQVRMELSDRVMKALAQHFPSDVRVPPLPAGVTPAVAFVAEALTRLAIGGDAPEPFNAGLRIVGEALASAAVTWPGKWACLRRMRAYLNEDKDAPVVLLSDMADSGAKCVEALRAAGVRVADAFRFRTVDHGLDPEVAQSVAQAPAVVSLTSAETPLRLASEQLGASHALDIGGAAHVFAFYSEPGAQRKFPAPQFIEHFFSETGGVPASTEVIGSDVSALAQWIERKLANRSAVTGRELIERLTELDSAEEPFARVCPEPVLSSPLDRIRPTLAALATRLAAQSAPAELSRTVAIQTARKSRPRLEPLGEFVTSYPNLHGRIRKFAEAFDSALSLTNSAAMRVVALLIEAETGCGKNLIVDFLGKRLRLDRRFLTVSVTISPEFVVSQLFGHEKGAFTGATNQRDGIFKEAERRPVFLNEVNSYERVVQTRLLTVIESGEFTPLGLEHKDPLNYNGVIVAASNEELVELVAKGTFRRDLQMRLGVPLKIPRLQDRPEDIELIFEHVRADLARKRRWVPPKLDDSARKRLSNYHWPGNARELAGLIRWAFLTQAEIIDTDFLKEHFPDIHDGTNRTMQPAERWLMHNVPIELCFFEHVLSLPNLTRKARYHLLSSRLYGTDPQTDEFTRWIECRASIIAKFRSDLPRAAAKIDDLTTKTRRHKRNLRGEEGSSRL